MKNPLHRFEMHAHNCFFFIAQLSIAVTEVEREKDIKLLPRIPLFLNRIARGLKFAKYIETSISSRTLQEN